LRDNKLNYSRRAGGNNTVLVALDDAVVSHPCGAGCVAVRAPFEGDFAAPWLLQRHVFELLASRGIAFVHSDLDAAWLDDVRPECFAELSLDLVFSQGLCFLPFHCVPRLAGPASDAVVRHPYSTRDRAVRVRALQQSGVWLRSGHKACRAEV
jgi:hypothetical protein